MRLINVRTLRCKVFPDSDIPRYAILSHRWNRDEAEVSYEDMSLLNKTGETNKFAKLLGFCNQARQSGCDYAWIDTCCINKSDPTELGEAINSMYRWYSEAAVCIVYLEDIFAGDHIRNSIWFSRGWTLQELIAPTQLCFYDRFWTFIGTKQELATTLFDITGIPVDVIDGSRLPSECSVAQRMSWAAERDTKRIEDRAYSLIGLFGISLPLLYGEHDQAFIHLQEEIIRKYDDESLFAWSLDNINHPQGCSGLLAPSPSSFISCRNVVTTSESSGFNVENGKLAITLPAVPYDMNTYCAYLSCTDQDRPSKRYAILLRRFQDGKQYCRVFYPNQLGRSIDLCRVSQENMHRKLRVPQLPTGTKDDLVYGFRLQAIKTPGYQDSRIQILSASRSNRSDTICCTPGFNSRVAGIVSIKPERSSDAGWSRIRWIVFGFDAEFNPVCVLANAQWNQTLNDKKFQQATKTRYGSSLRHSFLTSQIEWIDTAKQPPIARHGWEDGYCVIKGDAKRRQISRTLRGLNLQLDMKVEPCANPRTGTGERSVGENNCIWTVEISEAGFSPERERRNKLRSEAWQSTGLILGTVGLMIGPWVALRLHDAARRR